MGLSKRRILILLIVVQALPILVGLLEATGIQHWLAEMVFRVNADPDGEMHDNWFIRATRAYMANQFIGSLLLSVGGGLVTLVFIVLDKALPKGERVAWVVFGLLGMPETTVLFCILRILQMPKASEHSPPISAAMH